MFAQLLKLLILSTQLYISLHFGRRRLTSEPIDFCSVTVFKPNIQPPLTVSSMNIAPFEKKTTGRRKKKKYEWPLLVSKKNPNYKPKINSREHLNMNLGTFKLRTGYHEIITGNYTNKFTNTL